MIEESQRVEGSQLRCMKCAYDLTGATIGGRCPECGTSIEASLQAHQAPRACGTATASFVVGIVSLVVCGLAGPIAIGLAVSARKEMTRGGFAKSSQTMATVGLILGSIATVLTVGYVAAMFALEAW